MLYNTVWVRWSADTEAVPIVLAEKEERPLILEDVFSHFELSSDECVLVHDGVQLDPRLKLNLVNPDEVLVLYEKGPHGGIRLRSASTSGSRSGSSSIGSGSRSPGSPRTARGPALPDARELSVEALCEAQTLAAPLLHVDVDLHADSGLDISTDSEACSTPPPRIVASSAHNIPTALKKGDRSAAYGSHKPSSAAAKTVRVAVGAKTADHARPTSAARSKSNEGRSKRKGVHTSPRMQESTPRDSEAKSVKMGAQATASPRSARRAHTHTFDAPATYGSMTGYTSGEAAAASPPPTNLRRRTSSPPAMQRSVSATTVPLGVPRKTRMVSTSPDITDPGLRQLMKDLPKLNMGKAKKIQGGGILPSARRPATHRTTSPKAAASAQTSTYRRPSQSPMLTSGTFRRPLMSPTSARRTMSPTKIHRAPATARSHSSSQSASVASTAATATATATTTAASTSPLRVEDACARGKLYEVSVADLSKFLVDRGLSGQGGRKTLTARIERYSAVILKQANFTPLATTHRF